MSGSSPGFVYDQEPTAAEWDSYFTGKQDWSAILDAFVAAGGNVGYANLPASAQQEFLQFHQPGTVGAGATIDVGTPIPGTLVASPVGANVINNPSATVHAPLSTSVGGTLVTQGTITINTGGTITMPSFSAVEMGANTNDFVRIALPGDGSLGGVRFTYIFEKT